ncbi:MAG: glycosyltransferase [Candidatus Anstonellales archaeon]
MILIIAEGLGFGHLRRMERLRSYFEKKGEECLLLTDTKMEGEADADFLPISVPIHIEKNQIRLGTTMLEIMKKSNPLTINKIYNYVKRHNPEKVIVDTNLFSLAALTLLRKPVYYVTNNNDLSVFTSNGILDQGSNLLVSLIESRSQRVFVPDFPHPFSVCEYNLEIKNSSKYLFVGPMVERSASRKAKGRALFSFGKESHHYSKFLSMKTSFKKVLPDAEDPYAAEVVVSHGGHTTIMESLSKGIPMVLLPFTNYGERVNNAKKAVEMGVAVSANPAVLSEQGLEMAIEKAASLAPNASIFKKKAGEMDPYKAIYEEVFGA